MKLKSILPFVVSALLGVAMFPGFSPAQSLPLDRRAVVRAAFENFISVVYLLSGSERFLTMLSPEEKAQFELLGHILIPHVFVFGPVKSGEFRTSALLPTRLIFSDRNEDFILTGEPTVRTAKMDPAKNIFFNLNIINDPKTPIALLDSYQLLYHEFGHLLDEKVKDQDAINRIAAKIRTYLESSIREIQVTKSVHVTTHFPPQLLINDIPLDYQPEPIVLITKDGIVFETKFRSSLHPVAQGYSTLKPNDLHAVERDIATPSAEIADGKLLLKWIIETGHFFVDHSHLNYIQLFSNVDKVSDRLPFDPYYTANETFMEIDLTRLSQGMEIRRTAESRVLTPSSTTLKWHEPLAIKSVGPGRTELEGVFETDLTVDDATIEGRVNTDVFQFPATVSEMTKNYYRIQVYVPNETPFGNSIFVSSVALNPSTSDAPSIALSDQIEIKTSTGKPANELRPARTTDVWNGVSWIAADRITTPALDASDIRFRFYVKGATTLLNHVEVSWFLSEEIDRGSEHVGSKNAIRLEIIPASRLKQSFVGSQLVVEFGTTLATRALAPRVGRFGLTSRDSDYRAFISAQFVDGNLNSVLVPSRLAKGEWRTLFKFPANRDPRSHNTRECGDIFAPSL